MQYMLHWTISGWMTNNRLRLIAKQLISLLQVYEDNASNINISSMLSSLIIAAHHHALYLLFALHLTAIVTSKNKFLWKVAATSSIFVTYAEFFAIFIFQSPTPLLQHSLLVGLILKMKCVLLWAISGCMTNNKHMLNANKINWSYHLTIALSV